MAPKQSFTEPLKAILLPHYEAYQRSDEPDEVLSQITKAIQRELDEFALSAGLQGITLNGGAASTKDEKAFEKELAATLIFFLDCAFAAESSAGSMDATENVLELTAAVSAVMSVEVAGLILLRAIEITTVLLERIRSMGCKLLGTFTKFLMRNPARNHDLLDQASQALLPRFTDKSQTVRQAAIEAGNYFFANDTTDPDILQALVYSVQHDPSVASRVAALQSLPINLETVDVLLSRVRDVKEKVRVTALKVLEEKDAFPILEAEHCAALVEAGMTDRCVATKSATINMIRLGWMKAVNYDPITLLAKMNVAEYDSQCEMLLKAVVTATGQDLESLNALETEAYRNGLKGSLITITSAEQDLAVESLFYARVVCCQTKEATSFVFGNTQSAAMEVLPDVTIGCDILEWNVSKLMEAIGEEDQENEDVYTAICQQLLLLLTTVADVEEGSRRHLITVMKRMLSSIVTPDELVEDVIKVLQAMVNCETSFIDEVVEVVHEISRLNDIVGEELQENHILRSISILTIVCEKSSPCATSYAAMSKFACQVLPMLSHDSEVVKEAAVSCLGKLGFFTDRETITTSFEPLLMGMVIDEDESIVVQAQALLALSDWSMLNQDVKRLITVDDSASSVYDVVTSWFNSSESFSICIAAEIATKLLFNGIVCEKLWLAHLVLVFFDPRLQTAALEEADGDDEEDVKQIGSPLRLQQLLSVFFPAFCVQSDKARDDLLHSIEFLINIVHQKQTKAKKPRGFRALPVDKMVSFIEDSVRRGDDIAENAEEANALENDHGAETLLNDAPQASIELSVAVQIAAFLEKMHAETGLTFMRTLFKMLNGIDLSSGINEEPTSVVATLKDLLERLTVAVDDDSCLRGMEPMCVVLANVTVESEDEAIVSAKDGDRDEDLVESLNSLVIDEDNNSHTGKENANRAQSSAKDVENVFESPNARAGLSVLE
ncbi:hypothetical protein MPSEU_001051500 [Mayamaea pseudoterrestris]|nr:hypothetical protein MPSEU_001051500 [Mayamaea pseudoterrestris]